MSEQEAKECISVNIRTKEQLYAANMSFIKDGALFIPTTRDFRLGDLLMLDIRLVDEKEPYTLRAKVVWVTPAGAQRGLTPGIGLRFLDEKLGKELQAKVNTYLAGMIESEERTETM